MEAIDTFNGANAYLSNFHQHPFTWSGVEAPTAEHHFNAAKTLDPNQQAEVYAQPTPSKAKQVGRRITLRPEWDERVRFEVMASVVEAKFAVPELRERLLATGDALLVEGSRHHDQHWGCCSCAAHKPWPGQNHLGQTLMRLRSRLRGDPANRWPRVALTGHRPQDLSKQDQTWIRETLPTIVERLKTDHGTQVIVSGFAQGADTWWAGAAVEGGLPLWAYIPFEAQADKWHGREQLHWRRLRMRAEREVILGTDYDVRLLHARNDLMIRDADLIVAVHHPAKTTGGTVSAIKKSLALGRPMLRMNVATREITLVAPENRSAADAR